jgi:serine/threonine-protein kinase
MGEVYHARDPRLDRDVAIKVLPEHLARDPERVARFQREAKVLASLNHPHIAAIHGFEEVEGKRFLVMELVDGALSVEGALTITRQIAEALEAAHERGIIHRDLKPANVKITADGKTKVLDFGLAKAMTDELSASELAHSPTLTARHTRPGVVLGTAAYMSPEQARGKPVDKRTDIWSFGVVLYEVLCGCRPFEGETATDLVAKILEREPDWSTLPPQTPPIVQLLLRRCLAKDRNKRLHDIADARIDLEQAIADPTSSMLRLGDAAISAADSRIRRAVWRRSLPWVLIGMFAVALAITGVALWRATRPTPKPLVRLEVVMNAKEPPPGWGVQVAISPDGTRLAYLIGTWQSPHLYLRTLDQLEGNLLPGTQEAWNPFFSPDGQWVAFFAGKKLKKVSVLGGAPLTLCDVTDGGYGGTWGTDGTIVFALSDTGGLWRVPGAGGKAEELTKTDPTNKNATHRWPQFLPDGNSVIYTSHDDCHLFDFDEAIIEVVSLDTKQQKTLYRGGSYGRFVPSGHLVFVHKGTLFAAPFDLERLELTGPPTPVLEDVAFDSDYGNAEYDFSQTGTLVYRREAPSSQLSTLVWVDRQGAITPLLDTPREYGLLALAPDGKRLAVGIFEDKENPSDVWVYDIERESLTRLTSDDGWDKNPVWTPDGLRVTYTFGKDFDSRDIMWRLADGAGEAERLVESSLSQSPSTWSPDGKILVFSRWEEKTKGDIWYLRLGGDRKPEVFLQTPSSEWSAQFSPDGRWLAYESYESAMREIFVRPFPSGDRKWQISTDGGWSVRWSADGKELFYLQDNNMMAVTVSAEGASFSADKPRKLFEVPSSFSGWFDVSPDGQRFVMEKSAKEEKDADRTHLTFVFNWFEELQAKVAAGRP